MMTEQFQLEATEVSSRIQAAIDSVVKMKSVKQDDPIVGRTLIETTMILRDAQRVFEAMTVRVPTSD